MQIRKSEFNAGNWVGLGIAIALGGIIAGLVKLTWSFWASIGAML